MSHGDDQRQRIIGALAVEIAANGYGGTKIQDIARGAKVSLRTFYAEFPNKEACFLELYRQVTDALLGAITGSVVFDGSPWREVMARGFATHLTALESAPRLTYAAMIELATLSDEARAARQAWQQRLCDMLCEQIERGRREFPDIPARPLGPMMARAILGGVTEMTIDLIISDEYERLPELVDVATEMLWSAVTNGRGIAPFNAEPVAAPVS